MNVTLIHRLRPEALEEPQIGSDEHQSQGNDNAGCLDTRGAGAGPKTSSAAANEYMKPVHSAEYQW